MIRGDSGPRLRAALSALSYHLPQDPLCSFLDGCRRVLQGRSLDALPSQGPHDADAADASDASWLTLVVDEWAGLYDLSRLAAHVDVLSFARRRRGFGAARHAALREGRACDTPWILVVDADGQHHPAAIERVLREAEQSSWEAVIPQRSLVDLRLADAGAIDRVLAERFEAFVVARSVGRDEMTGTDLQPGLLLLRPAAADLLLAETRSRRYEWDLEAARCLLGSDLRLGFPRVETRPQPITFFGAADSVANLRYLRGLVGDAGLRAELTCFRASDCVREAFADPSLEALAAHVDEALAE